MSLEKVVCERHRDETGQQPGICPSCLRERLTQLTADRIGGLVCSDGDPWVATTHQRHGSDVERPVLDFTGAVGEALRKSNSMTSATVDESLKKKKGFWSRLTKMTRQK